MSTKKWVLVAVALSVMLVTVAVAQRTARYMHAQHDMGMFGPMGEHFTGFLADYLNLSDQQQQQIKTIMAAEKPKLQPLMADLKQAHQDIKTATDSGTLDQTKALSIIDAHKNSFAQLLVEHASIHQQVMGVLTPDQQTKLKELEQRHYDRMMQHHHASPPASSQQ
jgi:Spy/CpxP family protein refolding chaperone